MSNDENKKKNLAKKMTELSYETRRDVQYSVLKQWDRGYITGNQAIEEIVGLEKLIYIDVNYLARARSGQIHRP